jgi:glutamate carboxypeptidase
LQTSGKEAHSSLMFQKEGGYGAIFEAARILNEIRKTLSKEKYLSINPGIIMGGTKIKLQNIAGTAEGKSNVIAKTAEVHGDLRFLTPAQKKKAEKKMSIIALQSLPETHAKITFEDDIPAMVPSANNMKLLTLYSDVSQQLGYGSVRAVDPGKRGAGDISYIASTVPFNLAGLGAQGTGAHSEQETLEVDSLKQQTERAALLIYRLTQGWA